MASYQQYNDWSMPWRNTDSTTALAASNRITSDTTTTAVFVGKGLFAIEILVTETHFETGYDAIFFYVEANTVAASSTYVQLDCLPIGDSAGVGFANNVGNYVLIVNNIQDNQIRLNIKFKGSSDGVTYSSKATLIRDKLVA